LNYYAHLVAASWQNDDLEFGLGAMLPDFANMAKLRPIAEQRGSVGGGVEFHHHSDKVFHRLEGFRDLERWTLKHLLDRGLRRGPSRGVAHVGVELCLDGALVGRADQAYLGALACAADAHMQWSAPEHAGSFATLIERLSEIGIPHGYGDPEVLCYRLGRIFEPRPLLALNEADTAILSEAMPGIQARVHGASDSIMAALREGI
jgi:hypothetical protein